MTQPSGLELMGLSKPVAETQPVMQTVPVAETVTALKTVVMIDAKHDNVTHIPTITQKVGGYVTGTPDILWTQEDWDRFGDAGHVKIDQSVALDHYGSGLANVADIETGAGTIDAFVVQTKARLSRGQLGWVYGAEDTILGVSSSLRKAGVDLSKVGVWLANWNLNETEATSLIRTGIGGMRVVAVQWASPSSNPRTLVPGSSQTLSEANVDLSVAELSWFPFVAPKTPVVVPVAAPVVVTRIQAMAALKTVSEYFDSLAA